MYAGRSLACLAVGGGAPMLLHPVALGAEGHHGLLRQAHVTSMCPPSETRSGHGVRPGLQVLFHPVVSAQDAYAVLDELMAHLPFDRKGDGGRGDLALRRPRLDIRQPTEPAHGHGDHYSGVCVLMVGSASMIDLLLYVITVGKITEHLA